MSKDNKATDAWKKRQEKKIKENERQDQEDRFKRGGLPESDVNDGDAEKETGSDSNGGKSSSAGSFASNYISESSKGYRSALISDKHWKRGDRFTLDQDGFNKGITMRDRNESQFRFYPTSMTLPGYCVIDYMCYPGFFKNRENRYQPIEVAGKAFAEKMMLYKKSGSELLESTDLGMLHLVVSSIRQFVLWLEFIVKYFKSLGETVGENMPKIDWFTALNIKSDNVYGRSNAAPTLDYARDYSRLFDLTGDIETLEIDLNQLSLPSFEFEESFADLRKVYRDEDILSSQLYAFRPTGFWILTEYTEETGTSIQYYDIWKKKVDNIEVEIARSISELIDDIYEVGLNPLRNSALYRNAKNQYQLGEMRDPTLIGSIPKPNWDDVIAPVYDPEMLISIENLNINYNVVQSKMKSVISPPPEGDQIKQVPDRIDWVTMSQQLNGVDICMAMNTPLNFHKNPDDVTTEDVFRALRFKTLWSQNYSDDATRNTNRTVIGASNTIITGLRVTYAAGGNPVAPNGHYLYAVVKGSAITFDPDTTPASIWALIHAFKQFPRLPIITNLLNDGVNSRADVVGWTGDTATQVEVSNTNRVNFYRVMTETLWGNYDRIAY